MGLTAEGFASKKVNEFMVQKAFYKDNLGQISLDALCSHITLCAEMGRKENDLINNYPEMEYLYILLEEQLEFLAESVKNIIVIIQDLINSY